MTKVLNNARTPTITTETSVALIDIKLDDTTMHRGPRLSRCISLARINWGTLTETFPSRHQLILPFASGALIMLLLKHYNRIIQEDRVYIFLDGLDARLDNIRADVMTTHDTDGLQGAVLASKALTLTTSAHGKSAKNRNSTDGRKCSDCGNQKHTRENCFKLHGYLDWWHDLQAHTPPNLNSGIFGLALFTSHRDADCSAWLLDLGATDHMTFAASNFFSPTHQHS
ncbi:hypothetical protein Pint_30478 [Pistacia integerrima]|uniref:Uncharacterized protein n=1 Tax=Pistacia integerrima TaxID=434235 RepID=A0ACC0X3Q4_9ROSI|nr:hypothetical protein Pint_30478 [Pistacia integerrima]